MAAATKAAEAETAESGRSGGSGNRALVENGTSGSVAISGTSTRREETASVLEYLILAQRVIAG